MERLLCVAIGYACGCVLSAELVARIAAHRSIFELGNGNPGMANVARSLGARAALLCLAGDVGKVIVAAFVCLRLFPQLGALSAGWAGIGATLGHNAPFWHGFRGGKGVATLSATIVLLSPPWSLVAVASAALALLCWGYLSVAAVAGAGAFALVMVMRGPAELALVAGLCLMLALWGQLGNLRGITDGTAKRDFGGMR